MHVDWGGNVGKGVREDQTHRPNDQSSAILIDTLFWRSENSYLLYGKNKGRFAGTSNLLRSGRPAMRLLIVLFLLVLSGLGNSALGQQSSSIATPGKTDNIAYRILFQRTLQYRSNEFGYSYVF
jgi:hypothetical protein